MMISEVATQGRTRRILYLCKQGVAALFSFFRNHHFQNAARWARGPVLKGPARRILKMMISEVATEGRTNPILYLCKLDTIFKVPELRTPLLGSPYYEIG